MEYKIDKISEKRHNISEEESNIIKTALPYYKSMLDRYENTLVRLKDENDKVKEIPKTIDVENPFIPNMSEPKNYIPTIDEIKTFVYSAWAKTVADVQTPYVSSGQKKKGIVKHCFREVQKGKFINRTIRETMNEFISKMKTLLNIEDEK